jgi:hypothetical protein
MKRNGILIFLFLFLNSCSKDTDLLPLVIGPEAATLVFPENLTQCFEGDILSTTESEVTFRWNPSENTDEYELHLTNLDTGTIQIFATQNTEIPIRLQRGVPYSWFINSVESSFGNTTMSEVWSFYNAGEAIISFIPFPAVALSPAHGANLNNTNSVTLSWSATDLDNDIENFDLYFGSSAPPEVFASSITDSTYPDIPVTANTEYFWRIVTRDQNGNESQSEVFSFTVN